MGPFDVFDEWGNWVGKFEPAGGGANGFLMGIVVMVAVGLAFTVYAVVKILVVATIEGFKSLFRLEFGKALLYLSPLIVLSSIFFLLTSLVAGSIGYVSVMQNKAINDVELKNFYTTNCLSYFGGGDFSTDEQCLVFTIVNNSDRNLTMRPVDYDNFSSESLDPRIEFEPCARGYFPGSVKSMQSKTWVCLKGNVSKTLCFRISMEYVQEPVYLGEYEEELCSAVVSR